MLLRSSPPGWACPKGYFSFFMLLGGSVETTRSLEVPLACVVGLDDGLSLDSSLVGIVW